MKGMLKVELYKFTHSRALLVIIGVLIALCTISIATGVYGSAENAIINISKDCMVPLLACAVYSAIILLDDFSNGLLRHFLSNGYKKKTIITAKFIHYILGCSSLLLIYPLVSVLLSAIILGVETSLLQVFVSMLVLFVKALPLYMGIFGLFFFFTIILQKGVIAMGLSVASTILIVVFTNKFYVSETSVLKFSPIIQIGEIAQNSTSAYWVAVGISLSVLAICLCCSIVKFDHDEL